MPVDEGSEGGLAAAAKGLHERLVPWIAVDEDIVELPSGATTLYGIVRCGACVGMLPFVDEDHVMLVEQFRYITGQTTWEMPIGGVHADESIEAAAQRELAEEVGVRAARLTPLTAYATSKSVVDETAHLFLADGLTPSTADADSLNGRRQVPRHRHTHRRRCPAPLRPDR